MFPTIPVWKTVKEAYALTFRDIKGVAWLAFWPFLAAFGIGAVLGFMSAFLHLRADVVGLVTPFTDAICGVFFGAALHRRRLFGISPATGKIKFQLKRTERLFLAFALTYTLVYRFLYPISAMFAVNGNIPAIALTVTFLAAIPTLLGGGLTFPAIAQGQPQAITVGWHLGRYIRMRLIAIVLLTSLPLSIPAQILQNPRLMQSGGAGFIASLLAVPLFVIAIATVIAALCRVYQIRTASLEATPQPPDGTVDAVPVSG